MNRQVSMTQEQVLKKNLSPHKIFFSPVGIMKILAIVVFLVGSILSLTFQVCSQLLPWLELAFPIIIVSCGIFITSIFVLSALGLARRIPNTWIKIDIFCCLLIAILALVLSSMMLGNCVTDGNISVAPGIFGIIGSLLLFIAAATLFITWQNSANDDSVIPKPKTFDLKRKSVMI